MLSRIPCAAVALSLMACCFGNPFQKQQAAPPVVEQGKQVAVADPIAQEKPPPKIEPEPIKKPVEKPVEKPAEKPKPKIAEIKLLEFAPGEIPVNTDAYFGVGWKGTFEMKKGYSMKVVRVLDERRAIVMMGQILFINGAYRYFEPQTLVIGNIDTSKMFDGQETHFTTKTEHRDVFHIEGTERIDNATYLVANRIGIVKK